MYGGAEVYLDAFQTSAPDENDCRFKLLSLFPYGKNSLRYPQPV
jgi:hypothetical protein